MSVVLGVLGYWAVVVAGFAGMRLSSRAAARLLGFSGLEWFSARLAPASRTRRFVVRTVGALGPGLVALLLSWAAFFFDGIATYDAERLSVMSESPAEAAGLRSGDRVLSVGSHRVRDFEDLRESIQRLPGPAELQVDRDGHTLRLVVTPRQHRIGVTPALVVARFQAGASLVHAWAMPFNVLRAELARFPPLRRAGRPDFRGPLGIMQSASRAGESGTLLGLLAQVSAVLWPFLAACQLFEAVSQKLFLVTHSGAASGHEEGYRLARFCQALLIAGLGSLASLLSRANLGPLSVAFFPVALLAGMSTYPLIWLAGGKLWGKVMAAACVLVALAVPGVTLGVVLLLLRAARRRLVELGFRVGWLSAAPPES